jgi:ATP-dependent helicase HrpA
LIQSLNEPAFAGFFVSDSMTTTTDFSGLISQVQTPWQFYYRKRLKSLSKIKDRVKRDSAQKKLSQQIEQNIAKKHMRQSQLPKANYNQSLPFFQALDDVKALIEANQVVILAGETGSGKTTQIPQLCLDIGRGVDGLIAHTQPRRIAATSVASRIAEELKVKLGDAVGYQIRFTDKSHSKTYIKLMTDGILLTEIQHDPLLRQYDTIIIDEAHERSLNIDLLLGHIKTILPKRPDLKVVITSATIDVETFSKHFNRAPVIEVSGRTFPVEVRYQPLEIPAFDESGKEKSPITIDLNDGIAQAIDQCLKEQSGDILVFLSGEGEIRAAEKYLKRHRLNGFVDILPLYARLPKAQQNLVFQPSHKTKVVLTTNIAETSLTIEGIRYVIDAGYARMSRYSPKSKVQRLPIEKISQSSANQRKGRCGRISSGICIRLYSQDDFELRPVFTEPEIQRTNLASVILRMKAWGLGDIAAFPFIQAPNNRYISDGVRLLKELGGLNKDENLTDIGQKMATIPLEPRLSRMILQAHQERCVDEVLIICCGLNIQEPRKYPEKSLEAARQSHARFNHKESDFLTYLNLYQYLKQQRHDLSHSKFRKLCDKEFFGYQQVVEWFDLVQQLSDLLKDQKIHRSSSDDFEAIHRSLVAGLLSHLGQKDGEGNYVGARQVGFSIHPSSGLKKSKPAWIVANELLEINQLSGICIAKVEPLWLTELGTHLIKQKFYEPYWDIKSGRVACQHQVSLYGLILKKGTSSSYAKQFPVQAREIFIREALIQEQVQYAASWYQFNIDQIELIKEQERRQRRTDLLDESYIYQHYQHNLPEQVCDIASLRKALKKRPDLADDLKLNPKKLRHQSKGLSIEELYPKALKYQQYELPLEYHFEPGTKEDGVSISIPAPLLAKLPEDFGEYLVPGLLQDKIVALIKGLPKSIRRNFVPAPDFAQVVLEKLDRNQPGLIQQMSQILHGVTGVKVSDEEWADVAIPEHLCFLHKVLDADGNIIQQGRFLNNLDVNGQQVESKSDHGLPIELGTTIKQWDVSELPEVIITDDFGMRLERFPVLKKHGQSAKLELEDNQQIAQIVHAEGVAQLIAQQVWLQKKDYLAKTLPKRNQLGVCYASIGDKHALMRELNTAVTLSLLVDEDLAIYRKEAFQTQVDKVCEHFNLHAIELTEKLVELFERLIPIRKKVRNVKTIAYLHSYKDIGEQLTAMFQAGFISELNLNRIANYHRYLAGIENRMQRIEVSAPREEVAIMTIARCSEMIDDLKHELGQRRKLHLLPEVESLREMVQELRLSLFSPQIKTNMIISEKRIKKRIEEIRQS